MVSVFGESISRTKGMPAIWSFIKRRVCAKDFASILFSLTLLCGAGLLNTDKCIWAYAYEVNGWEDRPSHDILRFRWPSERQSIPLLIYNEKSKQNKNKQLLWFTNSSYESWPDSQISVTVKKHINKAHRSLLPVEWYLYAVELTKFFCLNLNLLSFETDSIFALILRVSVTLCFPVFHLETGRNRGFFALKKCHFIPFVKTYLAYNFEPNKILLLIQKLNSSLPK